MKSLGIVRKIDELGRIVLPIEIRRQLDIAPGDGVEIYSDEHSVVLKKYAPACIFCNEADETVTYMGKKICSKCLLQLKGENNRKTDMA